MPQERSSLYMDSGLTLFKHLSSFISVLIGAPYSSDTCYISTFAKPGPGIRDVTTQVWTLPFLPWPTKSGW